MFKTAVDRSAYSVTRAVSLTRSETPRLTWHLGARFCLALWRFVTDYVRNIDAFQFGLMESMVERSTVRKITT